MVLKPALLTGAEIRFLRKEVGKKAAEFAALINKTPEGKARANVLGWLLRRPKSGVHRN
jgi:DNA-binding transcriptional regulator YiaG